MDTQEKIVFYGKLTLLFNAVTLVGLLVLLLFWWLKPAQAACTSVQTGSYTSYNCSKLGSSIQTGPYTSYQGPLFEKPKRFAPKRKPLRKPAKPKKFQVKQK